MRKMLYYSSGQDKVGPRVFLSSTKLNKLLKIKNKLSVVELAFLLRNVSFDCNSTKNSLANYLSHYPEQLFEPVQMTSIGMTCPITLGDIVQEFGIVYVATDGVNPPSYQYLSDISVLKSQFKNRGNVCPLTRGEIQWFAFLSELDLPGVFLAENGPGIKHQYTDDEQALKRLFPIERRHSIAELQNANVMQNLKILEENFSPFYYLDDFTLRQIITEARLIEKLNSNMGLSQKCITALIATPNAQAGANENTSTLYRLSRTDSGDCLTLELVKSAVREDILRHLFSARWFIETLNSNAELKQRFITALVARRNAQARVNENTSALY